MTTTSIYRRIIRRETHSPRSALAIILAIALIVGFGWVGTEIVLALLGVPALLVAPADMFAAAVGLVELPAQIVAGAGMVVALIGLLLVIAAVAPGHRPRHILNTQRAATVVDNEVIASALARHACAVGNVEPDNTTVSVSRKRAIVRLTPTSGIPVNRNEVAETVTDQLRSFGLRSVVRAGVQVADRAKVGA